jgi:hypothetical protein
MIERGIRAMKGNQQILLPLNGHNRRWLDGEYSSAAQALNHAV